MTGSGTGREAGAPEDVRRLAERRADARAAKDFSAADALRDEIADQGWVVTDAPGGFSLESADQDRSSAEPVAPSQVESMLGHEPTFDVSIHWVCEGWLDDID